MHTQLNATDIKHILCNEESVNILCRTIHIIYVIYSILYLYYIIVLYRIIYTCKNESVLDFGAGVYVRDRFNVIVTVTFS